MKVRLLGGGIIEGNDVTELIRRMRAFAFFPERTAMDFKQGIADRCKITNGASICIETDTKFVNDLYTNGFMEII